MSSAATAKSASAPIGAWRSTLLAVVIAITIQVAHLASTGSATGLRMAFGAGRTLAIGLVVVGAIAGLQRRGWLGGRRGWLLLGAISLLVGSVTLVEDLAGFASALVPGAPRIALWGFVVAVAGGVVGAAFAGAWLDRPRLRLVAVAGGIAGLLINPRVLPGGYPGAHLYLVAASVALMAAGLKSTQPPARVWNAVRSGLPWGLAGLVALFSVLATPSHTLTLALLQPGGDVITPYLTRLRGTSDPSQGQIPEPWKPWFADRSQLDPIPPTPRETTPADPIVLLITIDSMRGDILENAKYRKRLPNLAKLRRTGLNLTQARAPGSQTVYTIAQMFMGTYYSQQYWSKHKGIRDLWPDDDKTTRFPELLSAAGVSTAHFGTTKWLTNEVGLVRGFGTDVFVKPKKTRYSLTTETFPEIFAHLEANSKGPLFVYTHALDAHYRVSPLAKKKKGKARHLANLEAVDEQIGKLRAKLDELGLTDRTYLIISSDHGEGFGEHGTKHHRDTLYEELLWVPLLIHGPGVKARKLGDPVTLIDLGPTILDLFKLDTPATIMGESLVPLFDGGSRTFSRPILAEGRLKKALIFPDGIKVIVDDRHHTAEVYDLSRDPAEAVNLLDAGDKEASQRIGTLRAFFDAHQIQKPGYEIPFRP